MTNNVSSVLGNAGSDCKQWRIFVIFVASGNENFHDLIYFRNLATKMSFSCI